MPSATGRGSSPCGESADLPDGAARVRVHAARRLVEKERLRLADERDGETELALLPARQAHRLRVCTLGQHHLGQHRADRAVELGSREALERAVQPQVLRRRQPLKDDVDLRAHAERVAD
eukprot:4377906-Prymnesium_polylepis.1